MNHRKQPDDGKKGASQRGASMLERGLHWPIGIAMILAIGVVVNLYMMRIAAGDPSFAVESDYYRKAVEHDDVMAQRALPILAQGNAFMAVGALHLPGQEGLVRLLRNAGYTVTSVH